MKQVAFAEAGKPDVLQVADADRPQGGDNQVVVKVVACGACGHDLSDRAGLTRIPLPSVLGHEIAGEVVEVGSKVSGFDVGDRVAAKQFTTCGRCLACRSGRELDCPTKRFIYGGYAEYVAVPADTLMHVPESVDMKKAAVVACAVGTCLQALDNIGQVRSGETVVVTGAGGGLGLHGVQVGKALGARVIAVTSSTEKVEQLKALGADDVVLARDEYAKEIESLTGGRGSDVVLDNVGHPEVFKHCFRSLAKRGRYVLTGQLYRERISFFPFFVFGKEAVITGSSSTLMSTFMRGMNLVEEGKIQPVVQEYKLSDAASAHADMERNAVFGRAVLVP